MKIFNLPDLAEDDLGEALEEAEIVHGHVREGDGVLAGRPLVSVETDEAVLAVRTPFSDQIMQIYGEADGMVELGTSFIGFEEGDRAETGSLFRCLKAKTEPEPDSRARKMPLRKESPKPPAGRSLALPLNHHAVSSGEAARFLTAVKTDFGQSPIKE